MQIMEKSNNSKVYIAILIDSITSLFATNTLDVTDLGFPRKLYRIGKVFSECNVAGLITSHLNKPIDKKNQGEILKPDETPPATARNKNPEEIQINSTSGSVFNRMQ